MSQRRLAFRRIASTSLTCCALLLTGACGGKEEVKPDLTPRLGLLELPSSHRVQDPEPSGAARVEITPSEVVVDGETALPLENGKIPAAERSDYDLPKLKAKLSGKKSMALSVFAAIPYATLARAIHSANGAGVSEISFKVRKPNDNKTSGWLTIRNSTFINKPDESKFDSSQLLPWENFTKVWDESLEACQTSSKGDCGYKPMAKAEGGKLDLMLRVRGSGYALRFRQAGAPPVVDAGVPDAGDKSAAAGKKAKAKTKGKKKGKGEMLDGIKAAPVAAEEAPPEPSTEHVFTLRTDQATIDPSPISGITKPVCGAVACPVVLDVEGISMSSQVVSLLGAAFPDGTPAPIVEWVLPPKE